MAEELETAKPASTKAALEFSFSDRLIGNPYLDEFREKVEELRDLASKLAPQGELVVSIVPNAERFRPISRALVNLVRMKRLYNERALMARPELAQELSKVATVIKQLNATVDKRRIINAKARAKINKPKTSKAKEQTPKQGE